MVVFYLFAAALLLLSLGLMLRVLRRSDSETRIDHERMNIALSKEQLDTLRDSFKAGQLDETEFVTAKSEIERNLAAALSTSVVSSIDSPAQSGADAVNADSTSIRGRWREVLIALLVVPFVVALSSWMYLEVGDKRALDADFVASMQAGGSASGTSASGQRSTQGSMGNNNPAATGQAGSNGEKLPSIEELLPKLEAHLETTPDDAQGWNLLGTTYLRLRRFTDAENALGKALDLIPDNPDLMLQLADTKAMLAQGSLLGEPARLVDKALQIVPDDPKAIWLKGMASQQAGDNQDAIARWQQLLPVMQEDAQAVAQLQSMIAEAKAAGGETASSGNADSTAEAATAAAPADTDSQMSKEELTPAESVAGLSVEVTLGAEFTSEFSPDTALFVYAKALNGPPMPLAVVKKSVADLPMKVILDDTMAMIPAMKLSAFDQVVVGARISKTGNPVGQPGDLYGEVAGASNTDQVSIVIDQRVQP